jgi:glutamate synthase domain-containing protein 1
MLKPDVYNIIGQNIANDNGFLRPDAPKSFQYVDQEAVSDSFARNEMLRRINHRGGSSAENFDISEHLIARAVDASFRKASKSTARLAANGSDAPPEFVGAKRVAKGKKSPSGKKSRKRARYVDYVSQDKPSV